ncbi:MAG: VRR-NUC domain-containing protein [Acidobacteriota bacterium]
MCDRLSRHLGRYRRGLPDLFVPSPSSPTGFELLEVKAPGDQLRPEQGAWIDYLNARGLPAKVLKLKAAAPGAG